MIFSISVESKPAKSRTIANPSLRSHRGSGHSHDRTASAGQRRRAAELPWTQHVNALGDRLKVEQILLNLLSNAVKATGCGGEIELTSGQNGTRAWIRVRDTGVGIPEDQLQAIFEPFVQVERRLSRPQEGTGLGLSISRQLARGMKGDLVASSHAGVGSVLTLTLPIATSNPDASTPAP